MVIVNLVFSVRPRFLIPRATEILSSSEYAPYLPILFNVSNSTLIVRY